MRFECSLEEYKKYKLGELVENVVAGATPKTSVDDYWNGGDIPWLSSGEVHKKFIYFTDKFITSEGYNNSSTKIVPTNSVLIALAGQGKTRGTVAINKIELCTNQSIASIIPNEMLNYKYLFYYLESKYEYLRTLSSSDGGRGGLNLKLIRSIPIQVPSIKEQENISNFINEIDKKILLLEQKHKLYDDFKKYLMQQIFTQKLRFDFKDEWKQYKLKDLLSVKSSSISINQLEDNTGTYPLLRFDYDMIKLKDICKINKGKQLNKDAMIENGKYYVLNGGKEPSGYTNEWNTSENTITISEGGNSCGYVNFNTEKFWSGGHCYYLSNLHENVDDYYLYSYLKFKEEFIMRLRVGSGLPNIQKRDIENIKIQIVSKDNQNKISNLLLSADKKINSIQIQKENFENFKKGLLQQMFVVQLILSLLQNKKHI